MSCSLSSETLYFLLFAIATTIIVAIVAIPRSAWAIERQHHLGLSPALAILDIKDKSTASVGIGGAIHYAYGLSDQLNLMIEGSSAIVAKNQQQDSPDKPHNRPAAVDQASVGVGYVIDILRWVPYIGLQGGVYRLAGGTMDAPLITPGIVLSAGLDYQITRHLAVGGAFREHLLLSKLDTYPSYTTFLLRFEYMWGY